MFKPTTCSNSFKVLLGITLRCWHFFFLLDKVDISVGKMTAVRQAITFLYTGTVNINYSTLKDLLEVADYLQIDDLKTECANYLNNMSITVENCLQLCFVASLYDLDVYSQASEYVLGHLPEVLQQADTLNLTPDSVLALLRDPTLNYVSKEDFFKFIVKWVESDKENRGQYFETMFCELDLKKMSRSFLESDVEMCELVSLSDKCRAHLLNVKMKHLAGLLPADDLTDVMLLVGGCGLSVPVPGFFALPFLPLSAIQSVNSLYAYVIEENRWAELAPLPVPMRCPIVMYKETDRCLYVYNGSLELPVLNSSALIYKYSFAENSWSTIHLTLPADLNEVTIHKIFTIENHGYAVVSGRVGAHISLCLLRLKSCMTRCSGFEVLCSAHCNSEIQACVALNRYICILGFRCSMSAKKIGKKTKFFIFDTVKGSHYEYSRGINYEPVMFAEKNQVYITRQGSQKYKRFDINTRRWSTLKDALMPMKDPPRTEIVHGTHNSKLYLFGGKSGQKLVSDVCAYDLANRTWETLESLPKEMYNSAVIPVRVPSSSVSCHIQCPHCKFANVPRQVLCAMAEYGDEDEEEEFDQDFMSDDDDVYSDFWDMDMYDDRDIYMYPEYGWF